MHETKLTGINSRRIMDAFDHERFSCLARDTNSNKQEVTSLLQRRARRWEKSSVMLT